MTAGDRAEAMARRVAASARRAGMDAAGAALVGAAVRLALRFRIPRLGDGAHPDALHPGRTALILLEDLEVREPETAAAGAACETVFPELAVPAATVAAELGAGVADRLAAVPVPDAVGDDLLELLVTADAPVRLIAAAERLDHARHLHLRPAPGWTGFHELTCSVYLPVAERTHPTAARRLRWWCGRFRDRYLVTTP